MAKSLEQIEKNVSASFGYVKKDLLMLNDAVSEIHDKIQHLSMNHATLLAEVESLKKMLGEKSKTKKKPSKKKSKKTKKR
jgi:regulator of replication initiation timing